MLRITAVLITTIIAISLTACSRGGGGSPPPPPPPPPPAPDDSVGGIWRGQRPNGTDIVALISESGEFRVLDPFGNQGIGQAVVSNTTDVSIDHQLVSPFGGSLIDGSDSASCELNGSIDERVSLNYDVTCTTSMGTVVGGPTSLTYDPVYEMDSAIANLVGVYDDNGDALVIDANGILFEQSARTGCVLNGQVSVIDADWNMYAVSFTTANCGPLYAPLDGASWNGLATLLNVMGVDTILGGFTADIGGSLVSLVVALPKI